MLANDSDPDGDPLQVSSVTQPNRGQAAVSDGGQTVTYTAPATFGGTVQFTYRVTDGRGGTATATVRVTVTAPSADLGIQVVDSPDPVEPFNGKVTYTVTVRNLARQAPASS